jgi:AcrR family transcriptional regulator
MSDRVSAAIGRALDERQRDAADEVERILDATVRVMQRVAPEPPRVGDIVAEAGSSNKAFYRYFAGKDDLMLAVMERGTAIVVSYLEHQMAKETEPAAKIRRWIEGILAQVADENLISMSRAAAAQISLTADRRLAEIEVTQPLRKLLAEPMSELAIPDPTRSADTVYMCTTATMRTYVASNHQPNRDDIEHLVGFCMRGLGVQAPEGRN